MPDSRDGEGRERREPRLRDLARRMFTDPDDAHGEGRMDAREMIGAVLESGDKAKTEVVRLIAREVRGYLDALELGDDIRDLLTNYSLEVHASFSLKPLAEAAGEPAPRGASRRKKPRTPRQAEEPAEDEGER